MRIIKKVLIIAVVLLVSNNAMAFPPGYEQKSGVIDHVSVVGAGNFAFRIKFKSRAAMCSNGETLNI